MVSGVQQLCKELGPVLEPTQALDPEGQLVPQEESSLLADVRKLLVENMERDSGASMLHESVNGLMAAVQEDMRRNAENQNAFSEHHPYFDGNGCTNPREFSD